MTVDVLPGFGCVEAELVGHNAYDGTVLVVQDFVVEGDAAAEERDYGGDGGDAP